MEPRLSITHSELATIPVFYAYVETATENNKIRQSEEKKSDLQTHVCLNYVLLPFFYLFESVQKVRHELCVRKKVLLKNIRGPGLIPCAHPGKFQFYD